MQVFFELPELNNGQNWESLFGLINSFDASLTASEDIRVDLRRKSVSFRGRPEAQDFGSDQSFRIQILHETVACELSMGREDPRSVL